MSSISFPHSVSAPSSRQQEMPESQYYSTEFDGSASFQINPLSTHPPRTPRVSVVSSSHMYGSSIYEERDELSESAHLETESIDEEEDVRMKEAERRIRPEEVWRDIVVTSNGRDKAFVRRQSLLLGF